MITQLTLFETEEVIGQQTIQWPELDPAHMWRIALHQYQEKRFKAGWRPWYKKGNQNDSGSR